MMHECENCGGIFEHPPKKFIVCKWCGFKFKLVGFNI